MLLHFLRKKFFLIAKQFNEVSRTVRIEPDCYVSGSTILGECVIKRGCKIYQSHVEGKVEINRFTTLWGPNIAVFGRLNGVQIGSFCSIARNVSIQEDYHNPKRLSTYFIERNILHLPPGNNCVISKGRITIGNDVWIGTGATILSGVKIGDGAIIAAGAIVTKNVPPFAIVAGNPAQVIKYRFSADKIEDILKMKWWEWPIERIREEKELFLKDYNESQ